MAPLARKQNGDVRSGEDGHLHRRVDLVVGRQIGRYDHQAALGRGHHMLEAGPHGSTVPCIGASGDQLDLRIPRPGRSLQAA